jgi:glycerol uptake facilitator protein
MVVPGGGVSAIIARSSQGGAAGWQLRFCSARSLAELIPWLYIAPRSSGAGVVAPVHQFVKPPRILWEVFMTPFSGEVLGTMLLVLLGDGTVANVVLTKSKAYASGWIVITTGWGMAVFVGAYTVFRVSDAHLNPAVTLAMAITGKLSWDKVPVYVAAQMIGAFLGAVLVWLAFLPHWAETSDAATKLGVFCTAPAIRRPWANLLTEIIGTFVLIIGIFGIKGAVMQSASSAAVPIDMGALGIIPVAFLVWVIGLALGGPTGYAINPARDLGPRIAHALLPIAGKGGNDWGYAWVPVVGPLIGAALTAWLYMALGSF